MLQVWCSGKAASGSESHAHTGAAASPDGAHGAGGAAGGLARLLKRLLSLEFLTCGGPGGT